MKCVFCNKEVDNIRKLSKHLRDNHKGLSIREYYDTYLKKENEGNCAVCNSPTRFVSLGAGYTNTCSCKCACTYNRSKLKNDQEKYTKFIKKVKDNQTRIWKDREENGEMDIIVNKIKNSNLEYYATLTNEEKKEKCGWLNKYHGKEREEKIRNLLINSLIPFYKNLSKEDHEKLIAKRLRSKEEIGSIRPQQEKSNFEIFEQKTRNLSNKTYNLYKSEIDPNNLRGKMYHLDHKVSIIFGFINGISEEILSSKENLEIIPAKENMKKHGKCSITLEELINDKLHEE